MDSGTCTRSESSAATARASATPLAGASTVAPLTGYATRSAASAAIAATKSLDAGSPVIVTEVEPDALPAYGCTVTPTDAVWPNSSAAVTVVVPACNPVTSSVRSIGLNTARATVASVVVSVRMPLGGDSAWTRTRCPRGTTIVAASNVTGTGVGDGLGDGDGPKVGCGEPMGGSGKPLGAAEGSKLAAGAAGDGESVGVGVGGSCAPAASELAPSSNAASAACSAAGDRRC